MIKQNKAVSQMVLAAMCLAISIVMPTIFHFAGPQGGKIFLPLFWGVAMAALLLPMKYGIMVGILAPILSHMISAMPAVPMLYFMLIELVIYAAMVHCFNQRFPAALAILLSLAVSRVSYIACVLLAAVFFDLPPAFAGLTVLVGGVVTSLPGIIAQAIVIPGIYHIYRRFSNV